MSYLQKMVDGGKSIENGSKAMHIKVPYSLAAEVAKLADFTAGFKVRRVRTHWDVDTAWELTTPGNYVYIADDGDLSVVAVLVREIVQRLGHAVPDQEPAQAPADEPVFLVWTDADSRAAIAEGWEVFEVGGMVDRNHLAIQRLDEVGRFGSDEEAIWHVYNKAVRERSPLHRKAFAITLQAKP